MHPQQVDMAPTWGAVNELEGCLSEGTRKAGGDYQGKYKHKPCSGTSWVLPGWVASLREETGDSAGQKAERESAVCSGSDG